MDPLADKLLIIAALLSLVSLNRLEAWVAMVIITRELAVTVLRLGATQAGVVIAASMFGKVKTCMQIAAILALIAVHGEPLWVSLLLYATVLVTVLSGLDYFFGLRRQPCAGQRPPDDRLARPGSRRPERRPQAHRRRATPRAWSGARRSSPELDLGAQLLRSGRGARRARCAGGSSPGSPGAPRRSSHRPALGSGRRTPAIISRTQSSTKRGRGDGPFRRPRPRLSASSARRSPRTCSPPTISSSDVASISVVALLHAADLQRRQPALVVGGHGHALRGCARSAPPRTRPAPGALAHGRDQLLRARARGHPGGRDADHAARAVLEGDRSPVQRVDLLRGDARYRRRLVLGIARGDAHLGAMRPPGARAPARRCAARASPPGTATRGARPRRSPR